MSPNQVRDISEAVFRGRLGKRDTAMMLKKDGDGGKKLRGRAGAYDAMTREYLRVLTPSRIHVSLETPISGEALEAALGESGE